MKTPRESGRSWRIGELARAAGVTVRTLHYYEHLGLLGPAGRSAGRHRVYRDADVRRLYVVRALRDLGLPLAEIRRTLASPDAALVQILRASLGGAIAQTPALEHAGRVRSLTTMMSTTGDPAVGQAHPRP